MRVSWIGLCGGLAAMTACGGGDDAIDGEGESAVECGDGADNDADDLVDCDDDGCATREQCVGGDTDSDSDSQAPLASAVINEFMASNGSTVQDETGAYADWIEVWNPEATPLDLTGWSLSDDFAEPDKSVLPAGVEVPAGGWLVLWADGLPELGPTHLAFSLSADGEEIGLYDADGNAIDTLVYDPQVQDWSAARVPDGASTWEITMSPSPGATNGSGT